MADEPIDSSIRTLAEALENLRNLENQRFEALSKLLPKLQNVEDLSEGTKFDVAAYTALEGRRGAMKTLFDSVAELTADHPCTDDDWQQIALREAESTVRRQARDDVPRRRVQIEIAERLELDLAFHNERLVGLGQRTADVKRLRDLKDAIEARQDVVAGCWADLYQALVSYAEVKAARLRVGQDGRDSALSDLFPALHRQLAPNPFGTGWKDNVAYVKAILTNAMRKIAQRPRDAPRPLDAVIFDGTDPDPLAMLVEETDRFRRILDNAGFDGDLVELQDGALIEKLAAGGDIAAEMAAVLVLRFRGWGVPEIVDESGLTRNQVAHRNRTAKARFTDIRELEVLLNVAGLTGVPADSTEPFLFDVLANLADPLATAALWILRFIGWTSQEIAEKTGADAGQVHALTAEGDRHLVVAIQNHNILLPHNKDGAPTVDFNDLNAAAQNDANEATRSIAVAILTGLHGATVATLAGDPYPTLGQLNTLHRTGWETLREALQ